MSNPFGPWATSIDVGGNPQLSAFWRRRLTMLVPASQTSPVLSRRNLLLLGAAGAVTAMLPTLRLVSVMADEEKPASESERPASGRIYLNALLKIKPPDRPEGQKVQWFIAVDPETGHWEWILDCGDRVSPDGKMVAVATKINAPRGLTETADLSTYDLTSRHTSPVADSVGGWGFSWSPDGQQVVSTETHETGDLQWQNVTWRVNRDGSGRTKLSIPATDIVADWSGDGTWFATIANRKPPYGRGFQLYRMRPDGSEELRLTKSGLNCSPRFSPDSRQIVYLHQTREEGNTLHVMDADGSNDHEVLRGEELLDVDSGCFSPDGRRLAVVRRNYQMKDGKKVLPKMGEGTWRLEIMDVDGASRRDLPLVDAETLWLWQPDWR